MAMNGKIPTSSPRQLRELGVMSRGQLQREIGRMQEELRRRETLARCALEKTTAAMKQPRTP